MPDIPPEVEQQFASMSDADWQAFTARVRAPDASEAFRTAAARIVSGDQLEAVCRVANLSAFVDDKGQIDQAKVESSLRNVFGVPAGPRWADHGQFTEQPNMGGPGDAGRAEAAKRFGHANGAHRFQGSRGSGGRAEAEKRFKTNGGQP